MPVTRRLESNVALITGAAAGIGRASAGAFLAEGARLVLTDLNVEPLEPFAREGALALRQDVADAIIDQNALQQKAVRSGEFRRSSRRRPSTNCQW